MIKPFHNAETEAVANEIAQAIIAEDRELYASIIKEKADPIMDKMVRWELLAFKERVHYLVNNSK